MTIVQTVAQVNADGLLVTALAVDDDGKSHEIVLNRQETCSLIENLAGALCVQLGYTKVKE